MVAFAAIPAHLLECAENARVEGNPGNGEEARAAAAVRPGPGMGRTHPCRWLAAQTKEKHGVRRHSRRRPGRPGVLLRRVPLRKAKGGGAVSAARDRRLGEERRVRGCQVL